MNTTTTNLDLVKVKRTADMNNTAKVIFKILAERDRFRRFTDLTHWTNELLKDGYKIVEEELMLVMKGLEAAGAGVVIYGRNGKHDRFEWFYNLKPLARYATGLTTAREEPIARLPKLKDRKPPKVRGPDKTKRVLTTLTTAITALIEKQVIIPLSTGGVIKLTLPAGITSKDIQTICNTLSQV